MFDRFVVLLGATRLVLCSRADLVAEKLRLRHKAAILARPRAAAPTRSASPSGVRRLGLPSVTYSMPRSGAPTAAGTIAERTDDLPLGNE